MNRLMSSVMRGIGRKRRRDEGEGGSSDDDANADPDFTPEMFDELLSSSATPINRNKRLPVKTKTSVAKASKTHSRKPIDKKKTVKTKPKPANTASTTSASTKNERRRNSRLATSSAAESANHSCRSGVANLDTMPTDVLLRIVQFAAGQVSIVSLSASLSQVCRRFRNFFNVESTILWKSADLSGLHGRLTIGQLHSLVLPRFPALRALNLEGWTALRDKDVEAICDKYGDTLSEVSLAGSDRLSGKSLACLAESCRRLTRLSLRRLPHRLAHGQLLSQLLQRHADSLADLSIDSIEGGIVGFGLLLSGLTDSPAALPALRRLRLAHLRSNSLRQWTFDMSALAASAPLLTELELVNLPLANGLQFVRPGCRLSQLKHLLVQELPNPGRLTVSSAALPSLTSLCVVAADFDLIDDFISNNENSNERGYQGLKRFVMSHSTNADEANTLAPLLRLAKLGQLNDLEEVDFTCSAVLNEPEDCAQLVEALASLLPSLRRLNLTATGIRLPAVRLIASIAESLIELNLNSCKYLPRGFKQLLQNRQSIEAWLAKDDSGGCDLD